MDVKKLSDEQVVRLVRTKDKELFAELIGRYEDKLRRYAEHLMGDEDKAADAVQEALIKAFVNLQGFDVKRKFSSWIYRIVHNEAVNELKKDKRWIRLETNEWLKEQLAGKVNIEKEYEDKEIRRELRDCLNKLPGDYQAVLSLYYFEDKSYEEIAEVLRVPMGTVAIRLKRGKEKLRQICINKGGMHEKGNESD